LGRLENVVKLIKKEDNMRIWLQSGVKVSNDERWIPYREYVVRHIEEVKRAETQIDFHGVQYEHPLMDHSAYILDLNETQLIENAIQAEREGYDCFAFSFSLDLGYYPIRNAVNIPVSFLGENCLHIATLLADKFAYLNWSKDLYLQFTQMARRYGLEANLIDCDYIEISEDELVQQIANPGWVVDKIQEIAKPAIRKGAGILVPDDNIISAVLFEAGLTEIDGVPIMDTVAVMVKAAEFLVDLERAGISRSQSGLYSRLSKEELSEVRDAFNIK
jgi:allantoin racemase